MDISPYIDHTLLKPTSLSGDIERLCGEAAQHRFAAVCVPPTFVDLARKCTASTGVKVATVIGFPFGYSAASAKLAETESAIASQADELDIVINLIHLKSGEWNQLEAEMQLLTRITHDHKKLLKVIIETGVLTHEEIINCCLLYASLGVDFLKTSTGYAEKGASVEAVSLMRKHLPASIRIKASGGIRTYDFAIKLIQAGADRLGCSASVAILEEALAAK
jgi:deoxyribose-phosphate aldolase